MVVTLSITRLNTRLLQPCFMVVTTLNYNLVTTLLHPCNKVVISVWVPPSLPLDHSPSLPPYLVYYLVYQIGNDALYLIRIHISFPQVLQGPFKIPQVQLMGTLNQIAGEKQKEEMPRYIRSNAANGTNAVLLLPQCYYRLEAQYAFILHPHIAYKCMQSVALLYVHVIMGK